jgi:hypothetical protein
MFWQATTGGSSSSDRHAIRLAPLLTAMVTTPLLVASPKMIQATLVNTKNTEGRGLNAPKSLFLSASCAVVGRLL